MKQKESLRSNQTIIRISTETFKKIQALSIELGYAQITTLEYLLSGKIPLDSIK